MLNFSAANGAFATLLAHRQRIFKCARYPLYLMLYKRYKWMLTLGNCAGNPDTFSLHRLLISPVVLSASAIAGFAGIYAL